LQEALCEVMKIAAKREGCDEAISWHGQGGGS